MLLLFIIAACIIVISITIFFFAVRFTVLKIRTKLVVMFLAITLISVTPIALLDFTTTRNALQTSANQAILSNATQTSARIDAFIVTNLDSVRTEAQLPGFAEYLGLPAERSTRELEATVQTTLRRLSRKDSLNIEAYALLDSTGQIIVATAALTDDPNPQNRDYIQTSLQTGLPAVSTLHINADNTRTALYFSSPVRNAIGVIQGLLVIRFNGNILQQLIARSNNFIGADSFATLVDENGIYLAHGRAPAVILTSVAPLDAAAISRLQNEERLRALPTEQLSTKLPMVAAGILATDTPFFSADSAFSNPAGYQNAVVTMQQKPWRVISSQPLTTLLAPLGMQTLNTIGLLFGLIALMICLALLGAQRLAGPITNLTRIVESFKTGDLSVRSAVDSPDEIGVLAQTFNSMANDLQHMVGTLEQQVAERTIALSTSLAEKEIQSQTLQAALQTQEQLNTLVLQLSAPLLPLRRGVLVVPLAGFVNATHVHDSLQYMLKAIEVQRVQTVIVDVTSIPMMDAAIAGTLIHTADTARLLGSKMLLVGIRPEVAQSLVELGTDISNLQTWSTLQQALESID